MDPDIQRAHAAVAELLTARMDVAPPGSPGQADPEVDFELIVPALVRVATEWNLDDRARLLLTTAIEAAGWMAYSAGVIFCKATQRPAADADGVAREIVQAYARGSTPGPSSPA
jgi:hypothetical protein